MLQTEREREYQSQDKRGSVAEFVSWESLEITAMAWTLPFFVVVCLHHLCGIPHPNKTDSQAEQTWFLIPRERRTKQNRKKIIIQKQISLKLIEYCQDLHIC